MNQVEHCGASVELPSVVHIDTNRVALRLASHNFRRKSCFRRQSFKPVNDATAVCRSRFVLRRLRSVASPRCKIMPGCRSRRQCRCQFPAHLCVPTVLVSHSVSLIPFQPDSAGVLSKGSMQRRCSFNNFSLQTVVDADHCSRVVAASAAAISCIFRNSIKASNISRV